MTAAGAGPDGRRQGPILHVTYAGREELRDAYMGFVKHGGLFVPTTRRFALGDELFVLVTLPGEPEPVGIAGRVVWLTPADAREPRRPGVGIQLFERESLKLQGRIEALVAGQSMERPTLTL